MKRLLLIAVLFVLVYAVQSYSEDYKQVKIHLQNPSVDIPRLVARGYDLEGSIRLKSNDVVVFLSDSEFESFKSLGFQYEILIDSWDRYYASLPIMTEAEKAAQLRESKLKYGVEGWGYGSMGGHYTLAEGNAQLDSMYLHYPNLISQKVSIGTTIENRPIYAVKISSSPNANNGKPEVVYFAVTHAREPAGMMALMYYMYYLLENYNTNPAVKYLVDNRQMYFVPFINPDGYEYNRSTNPNGGGMWRKNRRNNSGSYGVDLNRNFGPYDYWNAPNGGSSTDPTSDTYRGTAPFSEPETAALKNYVTGHTIKTSLSYHTCSNLLIYPYGALGHETPDSAIFREMAIDICSWNGYEYGTDLQTVGYSTRGNSDDFMYDGDIPGHGKSMAMTLELGSSSDGFWAPQARILPICQENLKPNLYYAYMAGEYVAVTAKQFDRQYFNPGDNVSMNITLKNKGLSTGRNLKVQLEPISTFVTVNSGTVMIDSISARTVYPVSSPFTFSIAANAPITEKAKLAMKVYTGASLMSIDTIALVLGTPQFAFRDTTNNPTTLWTITATPTTPTWEATTATFVTPPNSYTDSKSGQYSSNATVTMTLKNPVNLTGLANPKLSFKTKYDIETKWDCGVVLISTNNGSTWTPLQGLYTKPASGSGKQTPAGMPIYDGLTNDWLTEEIDLSSYANQQVKLRFELRTDGSITKDGWYLDDIGILTYVAPVSITWANGMTVKDSAGNQQVLTFGLAPTATDGVDLGLGEVSLPPFPPAGVFDARFELPVTPAEYSVKDYRRDTLKNVTWVTKFQAGALGYPMTFSWNLSALPAGSFRLKDNITGTIVNVDMRSQNSITLTNTGITALKIEYTMQSSFALQLAAGWNMVSIPLQAGNMAPAAVFPGANSSVYGYANGYTTPATLSNGAGYWVRYPSAATENVSGNTVTQTTVPLASGWNMIGVYQNNVPVSGITTTPSGIINSSFYGYNNGYVQPTTLNSGKGYWVRTSASGVMNLGTLAKDGNTFSANIEKDWASIIVSDASGNRSTLYAGTNVQNITNYELPPVPPQSSGIGGFDVRYSSNRNVEMLGDAKDINISNAQYPVTIQTNGIELRVRDRATNGKLVNEVIPANGTLRITNPAVSVIEVQTTETPLSYELMQNYPNPFNPTTSIKFGLPEKANVSLAIYNQLGEKIATLVNGELGAGYHKVEWNASNMTSGIYFYEIKTDKFSAVKKLVVLK